MLKRSETINYFHDDQIWKDYVRGELRHLKTPIWPDTWSILSGKYKELVSPELKKNSSESSLEEFVPARPSFSELIADLEEFLQHQILPVNKYPKTTSSEIGWKHTNAINFEKYSRHKHGKRNITKVFNWPPEGTF